MWAAKVAHFLRMKIKIKLKSGHPHRKMHFINHEINDVDFQIIELKTPTEIKHLRTEEAAKWFEIILLEDEKKTNEPDKSDAVTNEHQEKRGRSFRRERGE